MKRNVKTASAGAAEQKGTGAADTAPVAKTLTIAPPNMAWGTFRLPGDSYLCINRFSNKALTTMSETQKAGSTARTKRRRDPKDFDALCKNALYIDRSGVWFGIHAASLRKGMISACRLVDFKMVVAKMAFFVEPDGFDGVDGTPLIRIWPTDKKVPRSRERLIPGIQPEPENWVAPVRNATGVFDLRPRPRWWPGEWELRPTIRYDADLFTLPDITNLVARVGCQVGIGEGRPDSKNSAGLEAFGLFKVEEVSGAGREALAA